MMMRPFSMSFGRWQSIAVKHKKVISTSRSRWIVLQLTFTHWILASPVSIRQAVSRAVADQISSLRARELGNFFD
jgi:hypothetical protein